MTSEEQKNLSREELYEKYKDDDRYLLIEDGEDLIITPKFTDDDWKKLDKMLDEHPLFAKDLSNVEDNELLQALQAIKYDEPAEKILEQLYVGVV